MKRKFVVIVAELVDEASPETERIGIGKYRDQIINGPIIRTIFMS